MEPLLYFAIILLGTLVAGSLFKRFGLPAVVGELLVGILLGHGILNIIPDNNEIIHFTSELGVILLMFIAGLESDLGLLRKYLKSALAVAVIGLVAPLIAFTIAGLAFGYTSVEAIFFGVLFAATSVSITVEVLQEYRKLDSNEGATILGAAVADDILAVLILSVFVAIFGSNAAGNGGQLALGWMLLLQLVFLVVIALFAKFLIGPILDLAKKLPMNSSEAIVGVALALFFAWLADLVGMSGVLGAFFVGVMIAQTPHEAKIIPHVSSLGYTFFIPVFFASVGLVMDFHGVIAKLPFLIIFTILAVLTKLYGGRLGAQLTGFDKKSGILIGTGMIARGEMALVVASIGQQANIVSNEIYSDLVIVIILTTLIAPIMLKKQL
ncbi:cation:proton antiporter [Periweissella cryptocerci]|uniref:Cation:proton antiporter n=1 Tax=Periweissella cryptocerci TaxID=2506420 RepID=A0A4P6YU94_9LACO|nr:cation:proton antiporter [Periweissella cryptocerci]QBO36344.1 cation:proton antiporter [Periweissella cryptocerci]